MKKALLLTLLTASALMAKEVQLLDDHLRMELPDNAVIGERGTGIMEARPGNGETLYWIGDGDDRIAVHAAELFEYAAPDFMDIAFNAMKSTAREDNEVGTIGGNIVYAIIAPDATPKDDINVYGKALVRSADGMVQLVRFIFSRDVAKDIPAARELILKALNSLKTGEGGPDISARTVTFSKHPDNTILSIALPEGYYFKHREGPDFDVYDFKEVRKPGSAGSGIGMYIGLHPSESDDHTTTRSGKLLGENVTWRISPGAPGEQFYSASLIAPLWEEKERGMFGYLEYIHIWVYAETPEKRDELISVVEAMIWETAGQDK